MLARRVSVGEVVTTAVSYFEVVSGLQSTSAQERFEELLGLMAILPLDKAGAEAAATIDRALRQDGRRLDARDTLIAGIAISRGYPLLTRNRKHFDRVPGLVIEEL